MNLCLRRRIERILQFCLNILIHDLVHFVPTKRTKTKKKHSKFFFLIHEKNHCVLCIQVLCLIRCVKSSSTGSHKKFFTDFLKNLIFPKFSRIIHITVFFKCMDQVINKKVSTFDYYDYEFFSLPIT